MSDHNDKRPRSGVIRRIALALLALDVLLIGAFLATRLAPEETRSFAYLLDLDSSAAIPAWYAAGKLLLAGAAIAIFAWRVRQTSRLAGGVFSLMAVAMVCLSAHQVTSVFSLLREKAEPHLASLSGQAERLKSMFDQPGVADSQIWLLALGVPAGLAALGIVYSAFRAVGRTPPGGLRIGLGLGAFVVGSLGWSTFRPLIPASIPDPGPHSLALVEHVPQVVGATLLLWGGASLALASLAAAAASRIMQFNSPVRRAA